MTGIIIFGNGEVTQFGDGAQFNFKSMRIALEEVLRQIKELERKDLESRLKELEGNE